MMSKTLVDSLARELGIADCDLLLVGDGSGTAAHTPCGWFCTLFDRAKQAVSVHFGGANGGTNNYAELAPYIHALWAYHTQTFGNAGALPPAPVRVTIVSDSEVTVRCGTRRPDGTTVYQRKANLSLWAAIDWFESNNYCFTWVHVPRNSNPLSTRADREARRIRELLTHHPYPSHPDGNRQ